MSWTVRKMCNLLHRVLSLWLCWRGHGSCNRHSRVIWRGVCLLRVAFCRPTALRFSLLFGPTYLPFGPYSVYHIHLAVSTSLSATYRRRGLCGTIEMSNHHRFFQPCDMPDRCLSTTPVFGKEAVSTSLDKPSYTCYNVPRTEAANGRSLGTKQGNDVFHRRHDCHGRISSGQ